MITAERGSGTNVSSEFSFKGLSTDTKPTGTFQDTKIGNGSSFLEIDTKNLSFYDEENETWV